MGVRNSKIVGGGSIVLFDNENGFDWRIKMRA